LYRSCLAALKRHPARPDPAPGRGLYSCHAAPPIQQEDSPAKLARRMKRRWRIVLMRSRGELLGYVNV